MNATLFIVEELPSFEPFQIFIKYLENKYGDFRYNKMQCIQYFYCEKEDIPRTMYTCLTWFMIESRDVFAQSQFIKIFLSNIDTTFMDLATPRIILNYNGKATLTQVFDKVERCSKAFYQYDAINIVA